MEKTFRIWNKASGKWFDSHLFSIQAFFGTVQADGVTGTIGGCVIEQWTGLQYESGAKIYEGDVVEVRLASGQKVVAEIKMTDGCFEVQANNAYFLIVNHYSNRDYLKCYAVNHAVKKIGTIHETPELLRG